MSTTVTTGRFKLVAVALKVASLFGLFSKTKETRHPTGVMEDHNLEKMLSLVTIHFNQSSRNAGSE